MKTYEELQEEIIALNAKSELNHVLSNQPTNSELRDSMRIAKAIDSKFDLLRIRNRRTTWFGVEEMALRTEIDTYLHWK